MSPQVSTKVRLVRCPKCRQVLAELPEVTLYKCGGCGTVLQAKKRKMETDQTQQALKMKETVVNGQHDDAQGEKEARSSIGDNMNCQAGELSSNKSDVECEGEQRGSLSVSNDSSTSPDVSCNESEDLPVPSKLPAGHEENQFPSGQNQERTEERNGSQERAEETNGSVEFPGSGGKEPTAEDTRKQDEYVNQHDGYLGEKEPISHELSYPAGGSLLNEAEERCEDDKHGDRNVELNEDSSSFNRQSDSPEANCSESEDSVVQNSLGGAEGSRGLDEIRISPVEKLSLVKEDAQKLDEFTNQYISKDQNESEESQRELQEGDNFQVNVHSSYECKDKENDSPPMEKDEMNEITPAYKGEFFAEKIQDGINYSSVEIVSHENGDASANIELRVQVYGDDDETEEKCEDDKHGDRNVELNEDSSFINCQSDSPEANCIEIEDSAVQDSLGRAEGSRGLDEIRRSPEEKLSLVKEDAQKLDEFTNQYISEDQNESEESQRELQGGNNFQLNVHSSYECNDKKKDSPPMEKDETNEITPAYEGEFFAETIQDGIHSSSVEIVSHENGDASPNIELRVQVYGDDDETEGDLDTLASPRTEEESPQIASERSFVTLADPVSPDKDLSTLKSPRTEKERKANVGGSISRQSATKGGVVTPVDPVSPDSEHHLVPHRGSVSSVDTLGSPHPDIRSSELGVKTCEMTNSQVTRNYYAYDGSESSCDGTDDQIQEHVPRPSLRKSEDVDHNSIREIPVRYRLRANDMVNSDQEMNRRRPTSSILQEKQHHSMKDKFIESERLPFASREFVADHRTGNPLIHHHNRLPPHPGFHSKGKHSYSVPDKMDLLRTVCELKDQLDRMQFPERLPTREVNERSPHRYYDHLPPGMEIYGDANPRRTEQFNHHRPAFSGEFAHYRHQVNCSCLQCYPQDRYYSAQLPPHSTFLSSSTSPQQYLSSEMSSWGHETSFDDQRQRDEEIKRLYLKEKYHTAKKNLRPIAGGAPVLTCYHCSELLLLPEDFLLFEKKRYHQLRCNACNKVLKLSRRERTHIVQYVSDSPAPPPSEAGSVLLSDEYGRSFNRYPAMEGYNSTMLPQNGVVQQQKDRKMKSALKMGTVEAGGPSSKGGKMRNPASEIEERPTLHRLMGYTSPSQVFNK